MACGEVGLEIMYFYSLTPRQFYNVLKGWRKRNEKKENNHWEQTRLLMYSFLKPHAKNPDRFELTDVFKFPWEETQETEKSRKPKTREELKQIFDKK
ncbi:hypothetical protein ACIVBQ_000417 [Tenacibaculum discolor]